MPSLENGDGELRMVHVHVRIYKSVHEAAHFLSREKKELSSGVVVYFALSL